MSDLPPTPYTNDPMDNPDPYGSAYTSADDDTQPSTAIINSQPQTGPSGNAATGDELAFLGPDIPRDILDERPGDTYTKYVTTTTEGADYRPGGPGLVCTGPAYLAGWSYFDTTTGSTAFTVRLRDGLDASAPIVATVNLNNGMRWLMPGGIRLRFGLFVELVSGTASGTIYTRSIRAD